MISQLDKQFYAIPTGKKQVKKCHICHQKRQTTNKENPFVCEQDLRINARKLLLLKNEIIEKAKEVGRAEVRDEPNTTFWFIAIVFLIIGLGLGRYVLTLWF